jgi:cytoskeletal protein RodZ
VTKIRTDHLRALEEGNYDVFVAPVYIRGFVRSYARLLRLDEKTIMTDLDQELSLTEKFKEPPPLTNEPRGLLDAAMLQLSRVNWSIVLPVLLAGVLLLLAVWAYQAWWRYKNTDPLANLGPALYHPKPELKELYLPVPTNPPSATKGN